METESSATATGNTRDRPRSISLYDSSAISTNCWLGLDAISTASSSALKSDGFGGGLGSRPVRGCLGACAAGGHVASDVVGARLPGVGSEKGSAKAGPWSPNDEPKLQ